MQNLKNTVFVLCILSVFMHLFISCNPEKIIPEPPPPPPPPADTLYIEPTLLLRGYAEIENRIGAGDFSKDTLLQVGNMPAGIWEYKLVVESYTEMGELNIGNSEIKIGNSLKEKAWLGFSEKDSIEILLYLSSDTFNVEEHLVSIKVINEMYSIRNWRDLQAMQYNLKGDYKLCSDISFPERATEGFPEQGFVPIGTSGPDAAFTLNAFKGSLNGYGFAIKNFFIDRKNMNYVGLFGVLANTSTIKDFSIQLAVKNDGNGIFGGNYVGGIAGYIAENCVIENCKVSGSISGLDYIGGATGYLAKNSMLKLCRATGDISGNQYIGGLVGYAEEGSNISTSFTEINVSGRSDYTGGLVGFNDGIIYNCQVGSPGKNATIKGVDYVGGLIGRNGGELLGCRTNALIEGRNIVGGIAGYAIELSLMEQTCSKISIEGLTKVGGFVGCNYGRISNCYAIGDVEAISTIGGFAGEFYNEITNSFASVTVSTTASNSGGFIGHNSGTSTWCYWNNTGQTIPSVGTGSNYGIDEKTFDEFITFDGTVMPREIFTGWDFVTIWENEVPISSNNSLPGLKRELNFE